MSQMHFDGPISVDPALAMALWESMPDAAKSGVAQLFFSRFVTAPIADEALVAGTRVFFEKSQIPTKTANALKEAVGKKCVELAEKLTDTTAIRQIVEDETRKAAGEYAKANIGGIISAIPLEGFISAATPVILEVIRACAHHYFTRSQPGQNWMLELVQKVCADEDEAKEAVLATIGQMAKHRVAEAVA